MQNVQTTVKGLWEKVKGFFAKLNKKTRILLGVCAGVILALIIAAAVMLNHTEYELLQGGLNAGEISNLVQFLDSNGVTDYRVDGDKVYVPEGRAQALQAQLALSGNLTSGFLYEYYTDHVGGISGQSEQDRAWLIAREQKLAATIGLFEGVRSATVAITPGTDKIYVLEDTATPATATVTITPLTTNGVSGNVANAIRSLVSHSVEGLDIENVNIGDIYGNTYSDNGAVSQANEASALKAQLEESTNNQLRSQILDSLGAVYGVDNVKVGVRTTVDVNRRIIESTEYHQPDGSVEGGGLINSDHVFWEVIRDGSEPTGGTVGTTTNSNLPIYPDLNTELDGNAQYAGEQIDRDHSIDTTKQQIEQMAGTITDISISVTINQDCRNAGAMTAEEVRNFVAVGSGIGTETPEEHVAVMIAPFDVTTPTSGGDGNIIPGVPNWILFAALGGLVLFLVILIVVLLLVSRGKKKKLAKQLAEEEELRAAEAAAEAAAIIAAAPPTGGADIMEINTEKSMELRKTVRQFAQNNPEIAAQMVKAWLRGEENNG